MDSAISDSDLFEAARGGDAAAREAILVRHAPSVLRWARAACVDPRDGEDVAQEVLLAAARHLGDVHGAASLQSWLRAVTRNLCARQRRLRAGAPRTFDEVDPGTADGGHLPDEIVDQGERQEQLARALSALDDKYREVLVLRDVEGLTAPEVAETLGIGIDAVKSRLHRARAALREAFAPSRPRSPSCPDIALRYSQYLEGELDGAACDVLHAHVATCSSCDEACRSLGLAVGACRTMVAPTPEVVARVRAALRAVAQ